MSFQTNLMCIITFNRKTYNDIYEVKDDLAAVNTYIDKIKQEIQALAVMTEPQKLLETEEETSLMNIIINKIDSSFELLEDYYTEKFKLQSLLDNWSNCHNVKGLANGIPNKLFYKAYLDGDYVKTVKNEHP